MCYDGSFENIDQFDSHVKNILIFCVLVQMDSMTCLVHTVNWATCFNVILQTYDLRAPKKSGDYFEFSTFQSMEKNQILIFGPLDFQNTNNLPNLSVL